MTFQTTSVSLHLILRFNRSPIDLPQLQVFNFNILHHANLNIVRNCSTIDVPKLTFTPRKGIASGGLINKLLPHSVQNWCLTLRSPNR